MVEGERHREVFKEAYDETHRYLQAMGAAVAPEKSFTFSTERATRLALVGRIWQELGKPIQVVQHVRDLGSHLNTTLANRAVTLTARLVGGAGMVGKIAGLPTDPIKKA